MRTISCLILALCTSHLLVADVPSAKEIDALIAQLGDDNDEKRQSAAKKLEEIGEPAVDALRKAAKSHPDIDVQLRAGLVLRSITDKGWGEVRHFGAGGGYWLNRVAFTHDGKHAIATGGAVIVYDLESGKELRRSLERGFARNGFVMTRDGKYFLTGHQNDTILRRGEVETGKEVTGYGGHKQGIFAVALSPDDALAASGGADGLIYLWNLKDATKHRSWTAGQKVRALSFTPDGKHVLSGHFGPGADFSIILWDLEKGTEVRRFKGHTGDVTSLVVLPGGKEFLSSSMDGTVRRWNVESGKETAKFEHKGGVYEVVVSPDGKRAMTAGFGDRMVRVWEIATGKELHRFEGHKGAVLGVAFSADGKRALSSDSQCTIYLWRLSKQ
jgi:WD40 repeat protein